MTGAAGGGDEPRLVDLASLRRVETLAVAWTVVGAAGTAVLSPAGRSLAAALVLTAASAASIVSFRALQRVVSALRPEAPENRTPAGIDSPPPDGDEPLPRVAPHRSGRETVIALLRWAALGALLVTGALLLDRDLFPAIILGFSTLPAALMTEGLWQAVRALRGEDQ